MHLPQLIIDLAVILGVAAVVTYIFRVIRQPVVLGYIVAGIIVGPYTPPFFSVTDTASVQIWAELGVIFLMFALGLEFSFRRLARVGLPAVVTALVQIVIMFALGLLGAEWLGWGGLNGAFLGCMIAISSTTIIIKALDELDLKSKKFAELVFGILIVEDLAAILMLVALTNIAGNTDASSLSLIWAAVKLLLVVSVWLMLGLQIVPRFIKAVSTRGNDEMLVVLSMGLCLGMVALSGYFHYSAALGAFVMGSILAETKEVHRIEALVNPLKDVFGAVFFVSVGMLLNLKVIVQNPGPIACLTALIIFGKVFAVALGGILTRQGLRTSLSAAFSMAQIGEFSFIIANLGLSFAVLKPEIFPMIVAASLITTFTTPYLIKVAPWLIARLRPEMKAPTLQPQATEPVLDPWQGHLTSLLVHPNAYACGHTLASLKIRERFGVNVIAVLRGEASFVAPGADFVLFPHDQLQVFGVDEGLDEVRKELETKRPIPLPSESNERFQLSSYAVSPKSQLIGQSLKQSQLGQVCGAVVVAIERAEQRILNPNSEFILQAEDLLWVAEDAQRQEYLTKLVEG